MADVSMFVVREMMEAELPAVLEIETACFGAPWTRTMFQDELRHSLSWLRVVVDENQRPAGFIVARHYGDVWHVMDLAVSPSRRRLGLGGRLLDGLLGHTPRDVPVVLEVREGNTGAIALYRSHGFRDSGRRPHYYVDTGEAALLMVYGPEMAW